MTRFQLAWDDTRTGRARLDGSDSARPLAWLRISWGDGHAVQHVDVYGDGATPGERQWLIRRATVLDALAICVEDVSRLRSVQVPGELPADELGDAWKHHSVVDVA